MAFFKRIKLDSNFEEWLEQKITVLKEEGVIKSETEDTEHSQDDSEPEELPTWRPLDLTSNMAAPAHGNKSHQNQAKSDSIAYRHLSTESNGGDYYKFVWEDDEEASVFDRDEYTKGIQEKSGKRRKNKAVARGVSDSGRLQNGGVYTRGDQSDYPLETSLSGREGLVLGIDKEKVAASYSTRRRTDCREMEEFRYDPADIIRLPDPRFSISDQDDIKRDLPILDVSRCAPTPETSPHHHDDSTGHGRSAASYPPDRSPGGGTGATGWEDSGAVRGDRDGSSTLDASWSTRSQILLPMDHMEMSMSSDEDDDDEILDDDLDARSELTSDDRAIVTVDQATLVQQWRSKSKRMRIAIIAAVLTISLIVFGLVTYLVVHLLTAKI